MLSNAAVNPVGLFIGFQEAPRLSGGGGLLIAGEMSAEAAIAI